MKPTPPSNITLHVDYLTPIETHEIDGRKFKVMYNSTNTMFQAYVGGRRFSNFVLRDLRGSLLTAADEEPELDRREHEYLVQKLKEHDRLLENQSPNEDNFGISLGDRRADILSLLEQLRERDWLRGDIAACRDFLATLGETRVIERHGFEQKLQENLDRLNAMDEELATKAIESSRKDPNGLP